MELSLDCVLVAEAVYRDDHKIHAKVISTIFGLTFREYSTTGYMCYIKDMEKYLESDALCVLQDILKLHTKNNRPVVSEGA